MQKRSQNNVVQVFSVSCSANSVDPFWHSLYQSTTSRTAKYHLLQLHHWPLRSAPIYVCTCHMNALLFLVSDVERGLLSSGKIWACQNLLLCTWHKEHKGRKPFACQNGTMKSPNSVAAGGGCFKNCYTTYTTRIVEWLTSCHCSWLVVAHCLVFMAEVRLYG